MGLAATQTRFLSLTARKSNIEYQGQQINQQRTVLSNKSANMYAEMLTLSVPVPPSTADYTSVQYIYTNSDGVRYQTTNFTKDAAKDTVINAVNMSDPSKTTTVTITEADVNAKNAATGRFTQIGGMTASVVEVVDNDKYEDAYNQYLYKQYLYEQEIQAINAKTEIIQQQDKALELQLNQLDTEQNEIKTELDALDKVIGDNVESSYKSFGG